MIEATADFARERYGAKVVYGDTDSVFVKFPDADLERTWELAADMEKMINVPGGPFVAPNYASRFPFDSKFARYSFADARLSLLSLNNPSPVLQAQQRMPRTYFFFEASGSVS